MRIKAVLSNGYTECRKVMVLNFADGTTDEEIEDCLYDIAMEWAEGYEYVARATVSEWTEEDSDEYYEGVIYDWEVCDDEDDC